MNQQRYDLVIEGGHVLDPAQGIDAVLDLGVVGGRIAALEPSLRQAAAASRVDVSGSFVIPGIIDAHCHAYHAGTLLGLPPDTVGVDSGVPVVTDTGSAGYATFEGFRRFVISTAKTRVLCFLNIAATGLALTPEIRTREDINVDRTVETAAAHKEIVRGIKFRTVGPGGAALGMGAFQLAQEVAQKSGLPLMVHIGDRTRSYDQTFVRSMLGALRPGDIVTHMYSNEAASLASENSSLIGDARRASARGVLFDAAPGTLGLSFRVAREALEHGLIPNTIGSDLTVVGRHNLVFSLPETLSKFLALGLTIKQVIGMVTTGPAQMLGLESELGALRVGMDANVSIIRTVSGPWRFTDSTGDTIQGDTACEPLACLVKGIFHRADWGPHPWGWLPQKVATASRRSYPTPRGPR